MHEWVRSKNYRDPASHRHRAQPARSDGSVWIWLPVDPAAGMEGAGHSRGCADRSCPAAGSYFALGDCDADADDSLHLQHAALRLLPRDPDV